MRALRTFLFLAIMVGFCVPAAAGISVTCSGVDDTIALQSAINTAQASGDEVLLPAVACRTTSPLTITDRVSIRGVGYQDDLGASYSTPYASFYPVPAMVKGSSILPGTHDTLQIATNRAVRLTGFQISYNQNAASGSNLAAIRLSDAGGSTDFNNRSVLRDITITNADTGIVLTNAMEFRVDNVNVMYFWTDGIVSNNPHGPSWCDCLITNSTLWGQNLPTVGAQIRVMSGGGLRIIGNKLNVGNGASGSGILLQPSLTVQQTMEPIIIANNSIEGQAVGINIANSNVTNAMITAVVISGNQIWSGVNAIRSNTNGTAKWLSGLSVVGNSLMVVGTPQGGQSVVVLDNANIVQITGNHYALSGGGTGWGNYFGVNTSGVNLQSNSYAPGLTPAFNNGIGNTIGGGSP